MADQKASAGQLAAGKKDEQSVAKARTAAAVAKATEPGAAAALKLEAWLRKVTTTQTADVEVNLQLGEFSLRRQALTPLPREVKRHPDFVCAFGESAGPIQSVQVSSTSNRRWLRLVGERHDLQLWQPDGRSVASATKATSPSRRPYPSGLRPSEMWVQQAIEAAGASHLQGMALTLPVHSLADGPIAVLHGLHAIGCVVDPVVRPLGHFLAHSAADSAIVSPVALPVLSSL